MIQSTTPRISKNHQRAKSRLLFACGFLAISMVHAVDVVSYTGSTYTQDFNSLPFTSGTSVNTNNPVTIGGTQYTFKSGTNATFDFASTIDTSGTTSGSTGGLGLSSTMSGWYGGAGVAIQFGASAGDQTKGGVISFGGQTSSNRALGLGATSTSGLTTFGVELVNNSGGTLNQIDLQFTEELWRQQTAQQTINIGYSIVGTPSAALPLTGTTSLGSFNFATGTSTGGTAQTAPISTASYNASGASTLVGSWATGTALWITWQTSASLSGGQELAIDGLSFSASLGAATPTWNTTSGTWTVGTGTNWTGGTGTAFFNGDNVTFNNTAGGTVTVDAGGVLPGSTLVNASSGTYTFTGGSIGGSGALSKSGGGTLVLSSTNGYTGGTNVNGGILSVGSDAALGAVTGGISFGGGTLQTSTGITSARSITMSGAGTFDTNGFDSTLSGNITGSGALTKVSAGALTLSGTNTFSGGTTLAAGTLNNNGSLTFGGGSVAVTVTGSATFNNNGTINQTGSGRAIRDNTGGLTLIVNNGSSMNSTASMQTSDGDVIQMAKSNSNVTLNNYGTMTSLDASGGGQAVDFNAITTGSNTVNNYSTGIMQAVEADAVRPGVNGFVNNDGLIKATTTTGSSSDGIDAQTNTGITIVNAASAGSGTGTGTIEGARHGITGGNVATDSVGNPTVNNGAYAMSITNNLGGTIKGDNGSGLNIDGLNGNEVVTIVNHGTITGNGHDIGNGAGHDGDGVDVDGLVNLTNTGLIQSINAFGFGGEIEFSEGVTVGGGTITNSGTIEGSVASGNTTAIGRGITIAGVDKLLTTVGTTVTETAIPAQAPYGAAVITNSGSIIGDSDSAIIFSSAAASGFSHSITNQAGGLIQTGSTTAPAILLAADTTTINNSGTIDGSSSGKAITGGAGNLTLKILSGTASILGNVTGGSGTNALVVDPGAGNTFSYAGTITGFATAEIKSGTFNLASTAAMTAGGTTLDGGTLAGNGTVTGLVTVTTGGVISPGNSPGKLTLQTGVDFSGGGKYLWQLASPADDSTPNAAGTDFDQIVLTGGTLTLGGTSLLTLDFSLLSAGDPNNSSNPFWQTDHSWTIIDDGGSATNPGSTNFSQITDFTFSDGYFTTTSDPNGDTVLNYQATPEPGSIGLLAFGTLGLLTRRRRRA